MYERLQKKYASNAQVDVIRESRNGMPFLKIVLKHRDDPKKNRIYSLTYVSSTIAAYTNYRNRMRWDLFGKTYSKTAGDFLRTLPEKDLVRGYSENPVQMLLDPTGFLRKLSHFEFQLSSDAAQKGIILDITGGSREPGRENIERVKMQMQSLIQIFLVFALGSDPSLFKAVNENCEVTSEGSEVHFHSEITEETLQAIRNHYTDHSEELKGQLKDQLR